jgi:hypothetical protein
MDLLKMIGRIFRAYVCFLMFCVGSSNKRWAEQATGRFTTDLKALVVVGHLSNGIFLDDINQHHQQISEMYHAFCFTTMETATPTTEIKV